MHDGHDMTLRSIAPAEAGAKAGALPVTRRMLVDLLRVGDALVIALCSAIGFYGYAVAVLGMQEDWKGFAAATLVGVLLTLATFQALGLYRFERMRFVLFQTSRVLLAWTGVVALLIVVAFLLKLSESFSRGWLILWWASGCAGLGALHLGGALTLQSWARQGKLLRRVAVYGAGEAGGRLVEEILTRSRQEIAIVGLFDDRRSRVPEVLHGQRVAGSSDDLLALARAHKLDAVIVALPPSAETRIAEMMRKLQQLAVDVSVGVEVPRGPWQVRNLVDFHGVPLLHVSERPLKDWEFVAKWGEDKLVASLALLVFAPLMLMIALAIKLESRGPVLFRQPRFGFNNHQITVFKFRTMRAESADPSGARQTIKDDPRLTRVGAFLRKYNLDELPQFLNVLRGDMSVVGPRAHPIGMKAADQLYYEAVDDYFARHRVKPGITGWAQVNGYRGETDTMDKARKRIEYDLHYIGNWSLTFDLRIIALTALRSFVDPNAY